MKYRAHNSTFSPQNFVTKADGSLLLEKFLKQLAVGIVGIHYIGVSPNFKITVLCGLKFYLKILSLEFQKATSKIEVFRSLPSLTWSRTATKMDGTLPH